jgi:lysozyme
MTAIELAGVMAKTFEGFYPHPYLCPAGVWTIGYGTIKYPNGIRVTKTDKNIDQRTALEYMYWELGHCLQSTLKYCPILANDEKKLAAITDFVYNLGAGRLQASTLRRRINQQDWTATQKELMRWVYGGGKVLPGLVLRRKAESTFFGVPTNAS